MDKFIKNINHRPPEEFTAKGMLKEGYSRMKTFLNELIYWAKTTGTFVGFVIPYIALYLVLVKGNNKVDDLIGKSTLYSFALFGILILILSLYFFFPAFKQLFRQMRD